MGDKRADTRQGVAIGRDGPLLHFKHSSKGSSSLFAVKLGLVLLAIQVCFCRTLQVEVAKRVMCSWPALNDKFLKLLCSTLWSAFLCIEIRAKQPYFAIYPPGCTRFQELPGLV